MSTHRVFQSIPSSAVAESPALLEDGASSTYLRMAQKKVRFKMIGVCSMQRKKRPRQPSKSPPRKRVRGAGRPALASSAVLSLGPIGWRTRWRTRTRVAADEWCSLVQLGMILPADILVIVFESFAFPSRCATWLDPNYYQDIGVQVELWHRDNTVCPIKSFAFHCEPTCPGWVLFDDDYAQFCRWKGSCITPRIIALQYHEECGGQRRVA